MIAKFTSAHRSAAICSLFAVSLFASSPQLAAADAAPEDDRESCKKNLTTLFSAIKAYRAEHKDLPAWLSDLVPEYIKDPNVLTCPTVRKTGNVNTFGIEDPKISTAYTYEFNDGPIPKTIPGGANRTMKEWKRRQMGLIGSKIPLVRCHHHTPLLNLSFDGKLYESEGAWENELTDEIDPAELFPIKLFATEAALAASSKAQADIPSRDPATPPNLIDLSRFYNAALTEGWHRTGPNEPIANDLAWLPRGIQKFGDIEFDTRGLIQLSSRKLHHPRFPLSVKNIPVGRKAARLHFLQSTGWSAAEGTPVATYVIRLANGKTQHFTVLYGTHVTDWVTQADPKDSSASMIAWAGRSPATDSQTVLHIYKTQWTNPEPDQTITSLDYLSTNNDPAPFLIAITAESP